MLWRLDNLAIFSFVFLFSPRSVVGPCDKSWKVQIQRAVWKDSWHPSWSPKHLSSWLDCVQARESRPASPVPDHVLPRAGQRVLQERLAAREILCFSLPRSASWKQGPLSGNFGKYWGGLLEIWFSSQVPTKLNQGTNAQHKFERMSSSGNG